jgi:hypothetical protein
MKEQEIKLLQKQTAKLNADDFDLEAWKTGAIIILERIFGPGNQKIAQMEKVRYDQSSWALREASGSKNMMTTCKKQGQEILEIAIEELKHLGSPEDIDEAKSSPLRKVLVEALEGELKISQYKVLLKIIHSDKKADIRKKELLETLTNYGHDVGENILASILLAEETKMVL